MENDNYISAIELFEIRRGLDLRIESLKESIDLCKKVGSDDTFWQAIMITLLCVAPCLFYRDKPPTPPSFSSDI